MLTKNLKVTDIEITAGRENEIWHNGYSFGKKAGAQEVIKHLQYEINDKNHGMTDASKIKMLIFNLWKQIELDETLYRTCLPEEMPEEE